LFISIEIGLIRKKYYEQIGISVKW